MDSLLLQFSNEENGHRLKLIGTKSGNLMSEATQKVTDLKISDYMVGGKPRG